MKCIRRFLSTLLILQMLAPLPTFASYDRMVTWSDLAADLDISQILKGPYASSTNLFESTINPSAYDVVLSDADGKIGRDFKVPPSMRKTVEFWLRVYTQYTSQQQVLFDARHPEIVYDVIDFRDIAANSRNAVVYEILREKRLKKTLQAYHSAFARLSRSRKSSKHSPEEIKILAALKNLRHKHSFADLSSNLHSQAGQRDNVMKGLLAAEAFLPRMEQIFASMRLPPELTRLSLVESSFDLRAYSRVGAVGVWQFMPNTGGRMLMINDGAGIDERLSPLKSTMAAARLLRENYSQFRSWPLAITSYNHGLRGLMKFRRAKEEREFDEVAGLFNPDSKTSPLGYAARNYYAEFLAMVHAEAYHSLFYGEVPKVSVRPIVFQKIEKSQTALKFALESGIGVQRLRQSNPDIRNLNRKLPVGFWIAVPGESDNFLGLTQPKVKRRRTASLREPRKTKKA